MSIADLHLRSDQRPRDDGRIVAALGRHRRRLASVAADLTDEQWVAPSRCGHWSVGDVLLHLCDTGFVFGERPAADVWEGGFDPNETPDRYVERHRRQSREWVADQLAARADEMVATIERWEAEVADHVVDSVWGATVDWRLIAAHLLWDGHMHERDMALPLGMTPAISPEDLHIAVAYGVMMCGVPAVLATSSLDPVELRLSGAGGGVFRIGAVDGVIDVHTTALDGPGEAPVGEVFDALAGRGAELTDLISDRPEVGALSFTGAHLRAAG